MYWKFHCEYKNEIYGSRQFKYTWSKDGSAHLQLSADIGHGTGGPHKAACHKFLTKKGLEPRKRTAKFSAWQKTKQMSLVKSFDIAQCANSKKKKK